MSLPSAAVRPPRSIAICVLFFTLTLANTAIAQQLSAITGQVRDESGAVLPGVTVLASSPVLQVKQVSDVTNVQGEYRITPLPIGTYTVSYQLDGFTSIRQEGIRLDLGATVRLDITMKLGTLTETLTVSGAAPVVDVSATSASTQFTRETLELTPTSRNGAISLMVQAPGVRAPGRLDVGGGTVGDTPEFSSFGQPIESFMVMEGLVTSDSRIQTQGGNYFDYNAMEEARVQTISNGPEVPSRGPALSMLLKSGGNEFHGGASYAYSSQHTEGNNVDDELRAQGITEGNPLLSRTDQGGDLGGRIIRDKLWFYGSGRYRPQDVIQLGVFKPDGSPGNGYKAEIITNQKISYQLRQASKLVFWNTWVQKYHYADTQTRFQAWESRLDRIPPIRASTWKGEWQEVRGNSLVMSFLFGRWTWTGGQNANFVESTPEATAAGVPQGLEIRMGNDESHGGGRPSRFDLTSQWQDGQSPNGGSWNDIWRYTSKGTLTYFKPDWFKGNHEFKAGFEYSPNRFIQGNGDRGAAGQYRLIFTGGATGQVGTPTQIELYNYPAIPQNNVTFTTAYGGDTWTIARRLTLELGGRFEHDTAEVPKQCRQAGPWSFTLAACTEKIPFQTLTSFAPRLYFSYDVTGNGTTVLKGGWGRFYKQRFMEENQMTNPFASVTSTYRWRDLNGNRLYDAGEVNDDPNGPDFISSTPAPGISNPDEKPMGTDQFALTVEKQLGRNFAVRASGVHIRTFNEQRLLNIMRPYEAYNIPISSPDPGNDGIVGNADDPGRTLTYWDYPAALRGRNFEKFMIINDPNSSERHTAVDLQVVKRISDNWQVLASYTATFNDAKVGHPLNRAAEYNPNAEINTGDQSTQRTFRASGLYRLPYGVAVSANFNSESGAPQSRQVLLRGGTQIPTFVINTDPLGTLQLPTTSYVDLRIDKSFELVQRQRVTLRVNFFNLLNANTIQTWNQRAGPTYLYPTLILRPRLMEFGVQYTF